MYIKKISLHDIKENCIYYYFFTNNEYFIFEKYYLKRKENRKFSILNEIFFRKNIRINKKKY